MQIPLDSLREVERERGISFDTLLEAIEKALASAYLRMAGADETRGARAVINRDSGEVTVFAQEVEIDPDTEDIEVIKEWEDTPDGRPQTPPKPWLGLTSEELQDLLAYLESLR